MMVLYSMFDLSIDFFFLKYIFRAIYSAFGQLMLVRLFFEFSALYLVPFMVCNCFLRL